MPAALSFRQKEELCPELLGFEGEQHLDIRNCLEQSPHRSLPLARTATVLKYQIKDIGPGRQNTGDHR
jgi:hypothetical protein